MADVRKEDNIDGSAVLLERMFGNTTEISKALSRTGTSTIDRRSCTEEPQNAVVEFWRDALLSQRPFGSQVGWQLSEVSAQKIKERLLRVRAGHTVGSTNDPSWAIVYRGSYKPKPDNSPVEEKNWEVCEAPLPMMSEYTVEAPIGTYETAGESCSAETLARDPDELLLSETCPESAGEGVEGTCNSFTEDVTICNTGS